MIRRKMCAIALCGVAAAGAARAQAEAPMPATLGKPQAATLGKPQADNGYVARGVAPNPGYPDGVRDVPMYPRFVPREYVAPTRPSYGTPRVQFAADQELVQDKGKDGEKKDTPTGPAPMTTPPGMSPGTPPPTPMPPTTPAVVPGGTVVSGPFGAAPYLEGQIAGYGVMGMPMPTVWFAPEFLYWRAKGVELPQMVTTAPPGSPGTLGDAATTVGVGGRDILDHWQSGFRRRAGCWFGNTSGIDLAFFCLGRNTENFTTASGGNPGVFQPFFDAARNAENSRIVAFDPGTGPILSGRISVLNSTDLCGFEFNYRSGFMSGSSTRLDWLCGYRFVKLRDVTTIETSSLALPAAAGVAGTQIGTFERFEADNRFNGLQCGVVGEWDLGCVSFGLRATLAAGITREQVKIDGSSAAFAPGGARAVAAGALLTQPSNLGDHDHTQFSILPEVGVTLGYQVSNNLRVFAGYNLLYWTDVVRAGEQIDRNVTSTQIPDPITGARAAIGGRPVFERQVNDLCVHGWTLGLEWRW